ncbi:MAG TPA: dicarboxylate/amino acid:cation symporter [Chromatiales bacterium]|nr:dicarboxylate/amino acid:cation symporter [Thiotrichales bacterium]HIP68335.1 dicarboxylate/amino acid:cation symporter [Chromatiales bacterium]
MPRLKLHWQILIALLLAVMVGSIASKESSLLGVSLLSILSFIGTMFLNALKMLIVPLIFSSIIVGIGNLGSKGNLGRLGTKTLIYYLFTSALAILTGLLLVNLIQPGLIDGEPARNILGLSENTESVLARVEDRGPADVIAIFQRMIPVNIISAAAQGQMLGLIFFSLLFGYFINHINDGPRETLRNFWQGVFEVMMKMTDLVMKFAPIGVFALVAKVVMISGLAAFKPLAVFFFTVLAALAIHLLITLPVILKLIAGVRPVKHFQAMSAALLTAFSTSSSAATLPITLDCVEKNAGVSNKTSSFVLPLGATVNMDGTALYECVAVLFIAQAYGADLGIAQQISVVVLALMTSIGVAGIPAASLVAITLILTSVGLPAEAIGLILAVDRVLDMCRTSVNVFSDSCGAVTIARTEGEETLLTK